jgi:hypothetical protein
MFDIGDFQRDYLGPVGREPIDQVQSDDTMLSHKQRALLSSICCLCRFPEYHEQPRHDCPILSCVLDAPPQETCNRPDHDRTLARVVRLDVARYPDGKYPPALSRIAR